MSGAAYTVTALKNVVGVTMQHTSTKKEDILLIKDTKCCYRDKPTLNSLLLKKSLIGWWVAKGTQSLFREYQKQSGKAEMRKE